MKRAEAEGDGRTLAECAATARCVWQVRASVRARYVWRRLRTRLGYSKAPQQLTMPGGRRDAQNGEQAMGGRRGDWADVGGAARSTHHTPKRRGGRVRKRKKKERTHTHTHTTEKEKKRGGVTQPARASRVKTCG